MTEQKVEVTEQLKATREELDNVKRQLAKNSDMEKSRRAIMENAQKKQLDDKEELISNLKVLVDETTSDREKADGIKKMVEQITTLSDDKREWYEKAETLELQLNQAREDLKHLEKQFADKVVELKKEIEDLRKQVDPVKVAQASAATANVTINNAEIESLRKECEELRSKLRESEFNATHSTKSSGGISSEEAAHFNKQVKELQRERDRLNDELKDAKSQVAKLKTLSEAGADKDRASAEASLALEKEASELKTKLRAAERLAADNEESLKSEQATSKRIKAELDALKAAQLAALEKVSGDAKSIEGQLNQRTQELAAERTSHQAEREAHEATKKKLDEIRKQLSVAQGGLEETNAAHAAELKAEREKFAKTLQDTKAQAAADIAAAQQRAKDDMKDLNKKLSTFTSKFSAMSEALSFITKNYRALQKQVRDLQGEIAPTVKQCKRDLLRALAEIDTQYKEMLRKYRKEMALRKQLHNELVDLKGNIRVFGRIRPIISEDGKGEDSKICVAPNKDDEEIIEVNKDGKVSQFELDKVFSAASTQQDVFNAAEDIIVSVIDGFNVCIFAYGQTGSGKTFTMDGPDSNPGLNRRALSRLFEIVEERKADWSFEVEVSVLEIYNETIHDLLGTDARAKLDIKHGKEGPFVPDLTKHPVKDAAEVRALFLKSQKNRSTHATHMNEASSRSHALLIVYVTGTNLSTGVQTRGKLNLIDLAGSERVNKSGAIDDKDRLKEATNINKSLSCLGDVIHALGAKQPHIPYRNSKLTHLLQDSLGGAAKTVMVVQVSPVVKNVGETVCSLNFALRVKKVELGTAKKESSSAEVAALKKRIRELEAGHS